MAAASFQIAASIASQLGLQVTGSAISNNDYQVYANFEISNFTNVTVSAHLMEVTHGEVEYPPLDIEPAKDMKFAVRKTKWSWYGSQGMALFWLGDRFLFVWWQVPLSRKGGANELFIGLGEAGNTKKEDMYRTKEDVQKFIQNRVDAFTRRFVSWDFNVYHEKLRHVKIEDIKFAVRGTMSTTSNATIKLEIVPINSANFASSLMKHIPEENRGDPSEDTLGESLLRLAMMGGELTITASSAE